MSSPATGIVLVHQSPDNALVLPQLLQVKFALQRAEKWPLLSAMQVGANQVFIPPAFETLSDSAAVARKRMVDRFESVEGKQLCFPYLDIWPVYATYSTSDRGSDNRSNTGSQGHCQSTPKSHSSRGS